MKAAEIAKVTKVVALRKVINKSLNEVFNQTNELRADFNSTTSSTFATIAEYELDQIAIIERKLAALKAALQEAAALK